MRIAIIGSGISGMLAAYLLQREHDVTVYEANDYVGGHTHTHRVELGGKDYSVDTGFIVFNYKTYPNFTRLLEQLGVASQPTTMSFSVHNAKADLEYNGTSINTLFAQRRNLFRGEFLSMIREILRFNREAKAVLGQDGEGPTLGEYLSENVYSDFFINNYIIPMGAAVWSSPLEGMYDFPAKSFIQFFENHGFLSVNDRPEWRYIEGGSQSYVEKLTAGFSDRIRLNSPVQSVERGSAHVTVRTADDTQEYDHVVIATHSDQALAMLADPSDTERSVLGDIAYQSNEAILHTDTSLLPERKLARAAWNYRIPPRPGHAVTVTYDMNALQCIDAPETLCVTLNQTDEVDPDKIISRMDYAHPVYTHATVRAQKRRAEISGINRTSYCGAYWSYGFHEDGARSGLAVAEEFGISL